MSGYAVDATELQQADALLEETAAQARAALASLTATAGQLLGGGWSSPAASAFRLGWYEWADAAQEALSALGELARTVGLAGTGYGSTEDAVRTAVAGTPA